MEFLLQFAKDQPLIVAIIGGVLLWMMNKGSLPAPTPAPSPGPQPEPLPSPTPNALQTILRTVLLPILKGLLEPVVGPLALAQAHPPTLGSDTFTFGSQSERCAAAATLANYCDDLGDMETAKLLREKVLPAVSHRNCKKKAEAIDATAK